MSAQAVPDQSGQSGVVLTANDRFKRSFGTWFWSSMIMATVFHFAVFFFFPEITPEDYSFTADEIEAIELPPEIEIPPPPEQIARPMLVIASADIDEDITIAPTTFEANPVEDLPPPPEAVAQTTDIAAAPTFTPFTVRPDIRNRDAVARALEREYPPLLRDAGIGGSVQVWFFIDEEGAVQRTLVNESSGHAALDEAAMRVADIIQFTPALNRDKHVPVWISLPITFQIR